MATSVTSEANISVAPVGSIYSIPTEAEIQASFSRLYEEAQWHRSQGCRIIVVQGLGFVGIAVATVMASATDSSSGQPLYFVIGVDLPSSNAFWKVAQLNDGVIPVVSPDAELSKLMHRAVCEVKNLCATVCERAYSLADVIMVDVPLDVRDRLTQSPTDIEIDLDGFEAAIRTIGRYTRPEALVLIETTVPVGTSEQIVMPILREEQARRGIDGPVYLAHAYERVMPGPNYIDSIRKYWRTYAGVDEASAAKAREFLSSFIDTDAYPLWELEDTTSCEMAKLLENSYRAANIALIYEWTLLAERTGINLFALIDSIRVRKGTHDNIRQPGFGVGGYCLTKDSLLAQWSSTHLFGGDVVLGMTLDALKINHRMPLHTFDLLAELAEDGLAGKVIAVCGVSYLPEVADTRNSPTELLVNELIDTGSTVIVHDPCVLRWPERPCIPLTQDLAECLEHADGIVFAIPHRLYCDLPPETLLDHTLLPPFIVDAQNIISDEKAKLLHRAGCRLLGVGKGHWRKRGYQCPKRTSDES